MASLGVFNKQRPGLVTAEVAGYAQRHAGFGALEGGFGTRGTCFKGGEFLLEKVVHGDLSFAQGAFNGAEAGAAQENALAFEETRVGPPAQPGFAAGIADKPPHPAKGAGDARCYGSGGRRHLSRKPNYMTWEAIAGKTLPQINPCSTSGNPKHDPCQVARVPLCGAVANGFSAHRQTKLRSVVPGFRGREEILEQSLSRRILLLFSIAALAVLSGCKKTPPTLSLLVWEGYADPSFIHGFEAQCQCKVSAAYMGSSDELVAKLRGGAASNYDVISPSSDVATMLSRSGLVAPLDLSKIPNYAQLSPNLTSRPLVRQNGKVYGVPLTWGPNPLLYDTTAFPKAAGNLGGAVGPEVCQQALVLG